jgi:glutamine synthetase
MFIRDEFGRNTTWSKLQETHHRRIHVAILGDDLDVFSHIHPEDFSQVSDLATVFVVELKFPKAGMYSMLVTYRPDGYSQDIEQRHVLKVMGSPEMTKPNYNFGLEHYFESEIVGNGVFTDTILFSTLTDSEHADYRVIASIGDQIRAGECTMIKFTFFNGNGTMADMNPYLGHAIHLLISNQERTVFDHIHGNVFDPEEHHHMAMIPDCSKHNHHSTVPDKFGPYLYANYVFPEPGIYRIIGQTIQSSYKMLIPAFLVKVM